MFDFKDVISPHKLNRQWILDRVSDNQIFAHYFGIFRLGRAYCSKLRKDSLPSVSFFIDKNGDILYKDLRTNETFGCFQYVQRLYQCDYKNALRIVANDFGLINVKDRTVSKEFMDATAEFDRTEKALTLIQFTPKPWDKESLAWWRFYEITEEELTANNIFNVARVFINKREVYNTQNYMRFVYVQDYIDETGAEQQGVKLYTPQDTHYKWISSIPLHIPFGLQQLKYQSDTCWVLKSQKDRVEMLKIFTDVIGTQNESEAAFPPELEEHLYKRFKNIIVCYGADPQGVEASTKITTRNPNIKYFNTPKNDYEKYGIEDPADYIKAYGLEAFKDLLKEKKFL